MVGVVVLALVAVAGALIVIDTLRLGISPMPTSRRVREVVLAQVPSDVDGEVHELGAGWGTLALPLARRCQRAKVVAWEAALVPWLVLTVRAKVSGLRNLEVRRADFLRGDFSRARVVVCYLFTGAMTALHERVRALEPGALVVSHTFAFRGWQPEALAEVADLYRTKVYRWRC